MTLTVVPGVLRAERTNERSEAKLEDRNLRSLREFADRFEKDLRRAGDIGRIQSDSPYVHGTAEAVFKLHEFNLEGKSRAIACWFGVLEEVEFILAGNPAYLLGIPPEEVAGVPAASAPAGVQSREKGVESFLEHIGKLGGSPSHAELDSALEQLASSEAKQQDVVEAAYARSVLQRTRRPRRFLVHRERPLQDAHDMFIGVPVYVRVQD